MCKFKVEGEGILAECKKFHVESDYFSSWCCCCTTYVFLLLFLFNLFSYHFFVDTDVPPAYPFSWLLVLITAHAIPTSVCEGK